MAKSKERGESNEKHSSVMGYFRRIFAIRPVLLKTRSNDEVIKQWLADHPGHTEMPKSIRNTLANLKSLLRKKSRAESHVVKDGQPHHSVNGFAPGQLERLELAIDDALSLAKSLDRDGLESVIKSLRRARNEVVWKLGQ